MTHLTPSTSRPPPISLSLSHSIYFSLSPPLSLTHFHFSLSLSHFISLSLSHPSISLPILHSLYLSLSLVLPLSLSSPFISPLISFSILLSFLPSDDSKAVCRRLRKHFLTPPPPPLPSPPDIIESQLSEVSCDTFGDQ
jgi:hypothetical protein